MECCYIPVLLWKRVLISWGHSLKTAIARHSNVIPLIANRLFPDKDTALETHKIWLTAYDESRATRDVKRGQVSPSRNTYTFQTVFDSHF